MARLQRDLPTYIAAADGFSIDHGDVADFAKGLLNWWKSQVSEVWAWSEAARIAFAMSPNSAGAERVFRCSRSCSVDSNTLPFPTTLAGKICFATATHGVLTKLASKAEHGR